MRSRRTNALFDEAVGRLDRRRIGQRDQDRDVGGQPQVERQRRVGRARDRAPRSRRPAPRSRPASPWRSACGARGAERAAVARDQPTPATGVSTISSPSPVGLAAQELAEAARRPRRAQQLVQRAARRIGVERDDLLRRLRQVDRDVGGEQRAPGAAAPDAERDQLGARGRGAATAGRSDGRRGASRCSLGHLVVGCRRRRRRRRASLSSAGSRGARQSSSSTFQYDASARPRNGSHSR